RRATPDDRQCPHCRAPRRARQGLQDRWRAHRLLRHESGRPGRTGPIVRRAVGPDQFWFSPDSRAAKTALDHVGATWVSRGPSGASADRVTTFLRTVYGLMFVGLGITAAVADAVAGSPAIIRTIASNHLLFVGVLTVELGLVFYLSARVQ